MVSIVKNITDIENIYTYFEFNDYSDWDEFDSLLSVLTDKMGWKILEKLDGIYSKHCILEKNNFVFKLMYHEDFGNCLCNQDKQHNNYYAQLEKIADEVVSKLGF